MFLDPRSQDCYVDWAAVAKDVVAAPRIDAGRNPYDRGLTDLVGELHPQRRVPHLVGQPRGRAAGTSSWVSGNLPFVRTNGAADGLSALGDPTRRAIFECLAERPRAVGELADALPVSRPAVSQHLKVLKDAGLVTERAAGTRRIYRLNPMAVAAMRDQLDTFWNRALAGYVQDRRRTTERSSHDADRGRGGAQGRSSSTRPIERAFAALHRRGSATSSRRSTTCSRLPSPRPSSSPGSAVTSSTAAPTAASAGGPASSPTSRPHGSCSAGTSARTWQIETDPDNTSEVEVRFIAVEPGPNPRRTRAPQHRPARTRLGSRPRRRRRRPGMAALPGPLRRPVPEGRLMTADHYQHRHRPAGSRGVRLRHRSHPVPRMAERCRRRTHGPGQAPPRSATSA